MNNTVSDRYFNEAKTFLPGGVNSPVRAFNAVGRNPVFIDSVKDDKIYDVDGNKWIDYVCSWGPGILGHAYDSVVYDVIEAVKKGLSFGAPNKGELDLAKLINACFPSMEMMRMVNSGTEAVMSALRLARGYTGREKVLKFAGCYHGHSDSMLVKAGSAGLTMAIPDSSGVTKGVAADTLVATYNDEESVKCLFEQNKGEIACVIVEPVAANMGVVPPQKGFLEFLRDITQKNGALLVFDEVITGFRLAKGGAQQYFNVKPDITVLGKIIGGGMPMGAFGASRDIMKCISPLGGVYQAGTLSGNPVAMAAGKATLSYIVEHDEMYVELEKKAEKLESALKTIPGVCVNREGSLLSAFMKEGKVLNYEDALACDLERFKNYFNYMFDNGIYLAPSQYEAIFVCNKHSDDDIEMTCKIIREYANK